MEINCDGLIGDYIHLRKTKLPGDITLVTRTLLGVEITTFKFKLLLVCQNEQKIIYPSQPCHGILPIVIHVEY